MYFHPWLPTVTPSQPISLPRPAPTCARTFGASENTASTWKNCRPRSVRSLCPSIFPCDNILHVSSGYPRSHDGSIIPDTVDTMWGTDLSTAYTGEGPAAVFVAIDHCAAECIGIYAHARATRFEALEPIRQGVRRHFGGFAKGIAHG